jgi:hypothetical protein
MTTEQINIIIKLIEAQSNLTLAATHSSDGGLVESVIVRRLEEELLATAEDK